MDLNDYLSSLNKRLEKDLESMHRMHDDFLDNLVNKRESTPHQPERRQEETIPRLKLDRRLEESSKSKIGTFESLYNETFLEETHMPIASYGFSDLDYSPLVTLLASVLEIELNLSVYQTIRQNHGINIRSFYNKDTNGPEIHIGDMRIDLGKKNQMLRKLYAIMSKDSKELSRDIDDLPGMLRILDKVIEARNDASHIKAIDREKFINFYRNFAELYNRYILSILNLKEQLQSPPDAQRRYWTSKEYSFSSYRSEDEQSDDDYIRSILEGWTSSSDRACSCGILFTDCSKLSVKYYGDTSQIRRLHRIFDEIIEEYKATGIRYSLLDVSDKHASILEQNPGWMGYHKILDEYCQENGISSKHPHGLFIIGGDDVIPMPQVENPCWETHSTMVLEQTVDADILYAFGSKAVSISQGRKLSFNALYEHLQDPRFFVGRLPLENGMMTTSFEEDICQYFTRAIQAHRSGGVQVSAPTLTTCHSAKECGRQMVEGIPLLQLNERFSRFEDNMILSPLTMLEYEKERHRNNDVIKDITNDTSVLDLCQKDYLETLSKADMLIFLLHGGYDPGKPVYYGDARKIDVSMSVIRKCNPATFTPEIFKRPSINIGVVAAVCCYGARFIGYSRNDSSLLTAMYNNTLLFYGSSRIAIGSFDQTLKSSNGQNEYSLVQMRLYLQNLLSGVQAGIAIQNARVEYSRHSNKARKDELGYEYNPYYYMTTILEFNLFGDPLLNAQKIMDMPSEDPNDTILDISFDIRNERRYQEVYSIEKSKSTSILDRVRRLVDNNFEEIHKKMSDTLYRYYKVDPRTLYSAHKYTDGFGRSGYTITYKDNDDAFDHYQMVDTDICGNIRSINETI